MSVSSVVLVVAGVALFVFALLRGSHMRVRGNVTGNVIGRDARGSTTMSYTSVGSDAAKPTSGPSRDWIAWLIAIVGVAVAAFGIYLDHPAMFGK